MTVQPLADELFDFLGGMAGDDWSFAGFDDHYPDLVVDSLEQNLHRRLLTYG